MFGQSRKGDAAATEAPRKRTGGITPAARSCCGLMTAKVVLCLMNVVSFALAAALVGVGAQKVSYGGVQSLMDAAGKRHLFLDPHVTLIVMGSLLMPLSGVGFWAAVRGAKRTLFLYFCACLLSLTALVYGSALCFIYASSDKATNELVTAYWDLVSAALQEESAVFDTARAQKAAETASRLLNNAGRMCIASALLLLVALVCASRVAGHGWMMARVGLAANVLTTGIGAAVVYLATITSRYNLGGDWAADFVGGIGGVIMIASLVGVLATVARWRFVLWPHFITLCFMAILLTAATVVTLTFGRTRVSSFARTGAGKVPAVFRTRVLGCATATLPPAQQPAVNGSTATLATLNLTQAQSEAVLVCAVDPEAAQRWWVTHLASLGAAGCVLLVTLLCNLVASGYLLFTGGPEDEEGRGGRRRRGGAREKRRRRRRRASSEDSSSSDEGVQLTRRSKGSKTAAEEEP